MVIQHNLMALNAHRQLGSNNAKVSKDLEKLSSGYRVNRAADDAAGLAISEKMRAQITGLERASLNAQDAVSLVQTAEGALAEVHSMLNRMVELAVESANGVYQTDEREKINNEVTALKEEIDRISAATNFNGIDMLGGSLSSKGSADGATFPQKDLVGSYVVTAGEVTLSGAPEEFIMKGTGKITVTSMPATQPDELVFSVASTDGGTLTFSMKMEGRISVENGDKYMLDLSPFGEIPIINDQHSMGAIPEWAIVQELANFLNDPSMTITPSTGGLVLQVGDTADSYNKLTVYIESMSTDGLELSGVDMRTQEGASDALKMIKSAIEMVSTTRGDLGALQNRLEYTISNLGVTTENLTAAESRIRDVDMAKQMMSFTKNNIISQSAQAMLAQANQQPQQVLQLLQ